jgi:hypothetical protein
MEIHFNAQRIGRNALPALRIGVTRWPPFNAFWAFLGDHRAARNRMTQVDCYPPPNSTRQARSVGRRNCLSTVWSAHRISPVRRVRRLARKGWQRASGGNLSRFCHALSRQCKTRFHNQRKRQRAKTLLADKSFHQTQGGRDWPLADNARPTAKQRAPRRCLGTLKRIATQSPSDQTKQNGQRLPAGRWSNHLQTL